MINNDFEALVLAFKLAITAPTKEKSKQATDLALSIASNMSELDIVRAKKIIEKKGN
tara:strand:+ start:3756 stop:3926 length:171 start_codon:yes stop_codon:yes gene_type:complete